MKNYLDGPDIFCLKQKYNYDPNTGLFTHKFDGTNGVKKGDVAGVKNRFGYLKISLFGVRYMAHRLAWLYVNEVWPSGQVDHIDRNRSNNAISNLRLATNCQNQWNSGLRKTNTSGHKNIYWNKKRNKWQVQVTHFGKPKTVGRYESLNEAIIAANKFREENRGEFANN